MTRRGRLGLALIPVLAVAAGMAARLRPDPKASWAKVERNDLVLSVEVTGLLQAVESVLLGPPPISDVWEFKLTMLAPEGSEVKKGRQVAAFDTADLERTLAEKRAEADEARAEIEKRTTDVAIQRRDAELKLAEAEARRRKAELKLDVPADVAKATELKKARLDLDLAVREIELSGRLMEQSQLSAASELRALKEKQERALGRVREIEDSMASMRVAAPRDGTVVYVTNRRSDKKKVGDSVWRAERVLEIPDLTHMKADGEVDEVDAGKVKTGQRVTLKLDSHPDDEFVGRVETVRTAVERPSWDAAVKVCKVDISLARTDREKMRPGMRFRGRIEVGRYPGTVVVPAEAVFARGGGPVAYRRTWTGFEIRPLVLGRRSREAIEVIEGLHAGDAVSRLDLGGGS